MGPAVIGLDALATRVPDGAFIALPPDNSLSPVALVGALIRRGVRNLHVLGVPVSGFATDLLIGAGCVARLTTSAVTLGEAGFAPRFTAAIKAGTLPITDATCPAVHTALQAAEKGVPFMPLRGLIGSDLVAARPDWRVIDNPFSEAPDPIVLIPALRPDVALIHAVAADRAGNVWVGRRRELATIAHAAKQTLVTVEHLVDGDLTEDETMAPGTIGSLYVSAIAVAERGAWPLGLLDRYGADQPAIDAYAREARTEEGFQAWLAAHVLAPAARAAE
ncbi:MAG: CoA synthetase [Acetobacteraceae bacterium]|jgi:glutaconate CoA-transferase subunit A|nr:CoA synthetase [Acetobacteraceae bacterium]